MYTEVTSPVAVYAAENWMAVGGMSVNISLIEQTLGDFNHAYWLRIGVVFDDDVDNPTPLEEVNYGDILAKESTDIGESDELGDSVIGAPPLACHTTTAISIPDQGKEDQQLYTIAVLSSEIGKLMVPRADDWVDLCAVSDTVCSFGRLFIAYNFFLCLLFFAGGSDRILHGKIQRSGRPPGHT